VIADATGPSSQWKAWVKEGFPIDDGESYSSFAGRQDFSKIWQGFGLATERENIDR